MPFGAGLVAARNAGAAKIVDPRPYAVGSLKDVFRKWPQLSNVLPAMGYSDEQLRELEQTINAAHCDVVVTGTPIDLSRLITSRHPIRHVRYELEEVGAPTIQNVLEPIVAQATMRVPVAGGCDGHGNDTRRRHRRARPYGPRLHPRRRPHPG
jgi:predicted GTPase